MPGETRLRPELSLASSARRAMRAAGARPSRETRLRPRARWSRETRLRHGPRDRNGAETTRPALHVQGDNETARNLDRPREETTRDTPATWRARILCPVDSR